MAPTDAEVRARRRHCSTRPEQLAYFATILGFIFVRTRQREPEPAVRKIKINMWNFATNWRRDPATLAGYPFNYPPHEKSPRSLPRHPGDRLRRSPNRQRARLPPLQSRRNHRRQIDGGAPPLFDRLLALVSRHGRRSVWSRHDRPPVGKRQGCGLDRRSRGWMPRSSSSKRSARRSIAFHDRDIAPEGRTLAESNQQSRYVVAHA